MVVKSEKNIILGKHPVPQWVWICNRRTCELSLSLPLPSQICLSVLLYLSSPRSLCLLLFLSLSLPFSGFHTVLDVQEHKVTARRAEPDNQNLLIILLLIYVFVARLKERGGTGLYSVYDRPGLAVNQSRNYFLSL